MLSYKLRPFEKLRPRMPLNFPGSSYKYVSYIIYLLCFRGQVFKLGQCGFRRHGDERCVDMSCCWAKKRDTLFRALSYARATGSSLKPYHSKVQ